jgi:helix-turn-helix protein
MSSEENARQDDDRADAGQASVGGAAPEPEAMEPPILTDAMGMRAMAHPVRMALLELFGFRETLTATQASEVLGESPANCAFHLRTLAKYGFIKEAGGGRGRERPWTMASRHVRINTELPDPQAALAADELVRLMFERWADRVRRGHAAGPLPGWEQATGWTRSHLFLTADETGELMKQLRQLLDKYQERLADPACRPDGARPVEWALFATPVTDWDGEDAAQ